MEPRPGLSRRIARRVLPAGVRRAVGGAAGVGAASRRRSERLGLRPGRPGGIARIHVGCGPSNVLDDWWNVDIRRFPGIDEVVDATEPWPWGEIEYVYGEHFLEHLAPDAALRFIVQAARAMRPGAVLRLSTPALEHVWVTHFDPSHGRPATDVIADTYRANRAFHGWGHRFLYSRPMIERVLGAVGFADPTYHAYGESEREELRGLERHPGWDVVEGWPSVWIVEAVAPGPAAAREDPIAALGLEIEERFAQFVRSGH